jgi:hypothetical protein
MQPFPLNRLTNYYYIEFLVYLVLYIYFLILLLQIKIEVICTFQKLMFFCY